MLTGTEAHEVKLYLVAHHAAVRDVLIEKTMEMKCSPWQYRRPGPAEEAMSVVERALLSRELVEVHERLAGRAWTHDVQETLSDVSSIVRRVTEAM